MFPLDNSLAEDAHPATCPSGSGRTFEEMERIAVIGCGGSGKTTLSRRLGGLLELPVIHIDGHYWREVEGVRIESTPEQWRDTHRELVAGRRWVIDGMKLGVLEERLAAADTAIFLDLPTMQLPVGHRSPTAALPGAATAPSWACTTTASAGRSSRGSARFAAASARAFSSCWLRPAGM